jgi:hypothetical protein
MIFTLHTIVGVALGPWYTLRVFDIVTLLHPFIGGLALYWLGRSRGIPRLWLLAGVALFMIGGVSTSRLQHVIQIVSYSWLPVLLALIVAMASKPTFWRALTLGLLAAFWAANANQVVFLGSVLLAAVAIYLIVRCDSPWRAAWMYTAAAMVSFLAFAPVASAILEVIGLSTRTQISIENATPNSFTTLVYASMFMPGIFGNLGEHREWWSPTDITQDFLYIGLVPLALYLFAVAWGFKWWKPTIAFWLGSLGFFVAYSFGVNAALHPFLFEHIPGFDLFLRPADAAYIINFLLAGGLLLLGREIASEMQTLDESAEKWCASRSRWLWLLLAVGIPYGAFLLGAAAENRGALPVLMGSYWRLTLHLAAFAVAAFLFRMLVVSKNHFFFALLLAGIFFAIELGAAGRYTGAFSHSYDRNAVARTQRQARNSEAKSVDAWLRNHTQPGTRVEVIGGRRSLGFSSSARWYNTQGYNPVRLKSYSERIGAFLPTREPRKFPDSADGPFDPRYDILGLRYVAFAESLLADGEAVQTPVAVAARQYRESLRSRGAQKVLVENGYEVWERPGRSLWLTISATDSAAGLIPAPCQLVDYRNSRVEISCSMPREGTLVVGEIWAPGWIAEVNGESAQIRPALDVFRAVEIPPGKSSVIMRYEPIPLLRWFASGKADDVG